MANPEHLAKLKEGVEAWNRWRAKNSRVLYDLSGADLKRRNLENANLHGVDLRGTQLREAKLRTANLYRADLTDAQLDWADLRGADLQDGYPRRANLHGADLYEAKLGGANLSGANLSIANLYGADLHGVLFEGANLNRANCGQANLSGATFGDTSFGGMLLKDAFGLDSCKHRAPSYLDYFTLQISWPLPLVFLRGCGLPDQYIDYLPSLLSQAIQFYSCFISHSTVDRRFAERIYSDLQNKNVRCWYAPEDLKIGDKFHEKIEDSIRLHDKLLIVLSEASVNSVWVEREVQAAREREDRSGKLALFPIRLDDAVENSTKAWAADLRRTRHIGDFTNWKDHDSYQQAFDRLLRDLKAQPADSASAGD